MSLFVVNGARDEMMELEHDGGNHGKLTTRCVFAWRRRAVKRTCRSEGTPARGSKFCLQKVHFTPPLLKEQINNGVLEYEILLMDPVDVE